MSTPMPKPPKDPKLMTIQELKDYAEKLKEHLNSTRKEREDRIAALQKELDKAFDDYNKATNSTNTTPIIASGSPSSSPSPTTTTIHKKPTAVPWKPIIGAGLVGLGGYGLYRHLKSDNRNKSKKNG